MIAGGKPVSRRQKTLPNRAVHRDNKPMPHWLIKAALQRGISWLPSSHKWNELFQRHVTRSTELTAERFEARLEYCRWHWDHFRRLLPARARAFRVLEIGTGWYPIVPLGLYLHGADSIWTFDIDPLVNGPRLACAVAMFDDYAARGQLQKFWPDLLPQRLTLLRALRTGNSTPDPVAQLESLGIHLRVQDASQTGLPPNSVDLMVSTGVLEYIPPPALTAILTEFNRIATPGAVMSHYLNLIDQYSYFDRSLNRLNFLKFPARQWKYLNSPLTWLNRLRISDYRALFHAAGFQIHTEENTLGTEDELAGIRLAPEFQKYSKDDLLVLFSRVVAQSVRKS